MKTKVIIEDGETRIVLTPDTDFEIDVIEKVKASDKRITHVHFNADYNYGTYSKHNIEMVIKDYNKTS